MDALHNVFPLPVPTCSADEQRLSRAMEAGTQPRELRKAFPKTIDRCGERAWTFLMICALNYLHLGWSPVAQVKVELPACVSPAQQASLDYLRSEAKSFLDGFGDAPMPSFDWEKLMSLKKVGYSGELALKGVNLT